MYAHAETIARAFAHEWAAFPKFNVVRNPWTKTVSDYLWRIKGRANPATFEEFVRAIERGDPLDDIVQPRYHDNRPLYTIGSSPTMWSASRLSRPGCLIPAPR